MSLTLRAVGERDLFEYSRVPIAIVVDSVLDVEPLIAGMGGLSLRERPVAEPYVKDYDEHGGPTSWPHRFNIADWHIVLAVDEDSVIGGAAAFPGEPSSIAILWDIRVRPDARGKGIGRALLEDTKAWARRRHFHWLKAETQNVNVGACRFYQRQGGILGAIDRFAYIGQAVAEHEVRLDWFFPLRPSDPRLTPT